MSSRSNPVALPRSGNLSPRPGGAQENQSAAVPGVPAIGAELSRSHPDEGTLAVFVTVIHRIHDPEGFEAAEAKALEAGLPSYVALPIHAATEDHSLGICIWEGERSTLCARWLKARSDHGRTTSTTRCTWTDLRRSSQSSRLIAAHRTWVIREQNPNRALGISDRANGVYGAGALRRPV